MYPTHTFDFGPVVGGGGGGGEFLSPIYKRLLNFATSVLFEWKYMKRLLLLRIKI